MTPAEFFGLKSALVQFHSHRLRPCFARDALSRTLRLSDVDHAYAELEADGLVIRDGTKTELLFDECGQRHERPRFVAAKCVPWAEAA